jgi:hypothetical protein
MQKNRTLFRPVGLAEMNLIIASGYRAFPPRLPDQPIFYPVTNREYAESIARAWNAPDEKCGFVGYVTEFDLPLDYFNKFEEKTLGAKICTELWVPAEQLDEFNSHIQGLIRIARAFYGEKFSGERLV